MTVPPPKLPTRAVAAVLGVVLALFGAIALAYKAGESKTETALTLAVADAKRVTDSLTLSLNASLSTLRVDTVAVQQIVHQWDTLVARVTDTLHTTERLVDTVTVRELVQAGTAALAVVDSQRRACFVLAGECQVAVTAANARAANEYALRVRAEGASQQRRTYRAVERGACVAVALSSVLLLGRK